MMLNHASIMGRLTRDPELRTTQSGISVASFTLAVERDYASRDGERETDFINVVAWRHTADFVDKYFSKGRMAVVSGHIQVRSYEDKRGDKRYVTEIVAENVYFGDSKKESGSGDNGDQRRSYSKEPADEQQEIGYGEFTDVDDDENLPF